MDEKKIAEFVIEYYKDSPIGHVQELVLILAKNPTCFNYMQDNRALRHTLYKHYLCSKYFEPRVLKDIQNSLDIRQLMLTVTRYPESIEYINPQQRFYKRLVDAAIEKDSHTIKYVMTPTVEQKRLAINNDPSNICLIKNKTNEDVSYAESLKPCIAEWLRKVCNETK